MYTPLPDNLTIKNSEIHGLGLFATQKIPKATFLGISHIQHPEAEDGWIRTPLGGFYNHSDSPNCHIIDQWYGLEEHRTISKNLFTIKDIYNGEEIACSYSIWTLDKNSKIDDSGSLKDWLGL